MESINSRISPMTQQSKSREAVFLTILGCTVLVWVLRGIGLLAFVPGFVLWVLFGLSITLIIVNGLIEIR
jgi:uncharacterized membrane protein (DUF485 family)